MLELLLSVEPSGAPSLESAPKFIREPLLLDLLGNSCGVGKAGFLGFALLGQATERGRLGLALLGCLALSLSLATCFDIAGSHTCPFGLGLLVPARLLSKTFA